jgi:hypothetical protein
MQLLGRASSPDGDPTVVMPTPAASRAALEITKPKHRRAPLSRSIAVGVGVLILIAGGFGVNAIHQRDVPIVPPAHDSAAAVPKSATGVPAAAGSAALTVPDSLPADAVASSSARSLARINARKPVPKPSERVLRVIGPADAAINVDGSVVGRGTWHSENITSGVHHVIVSLNAPAACASAQETKDVRVSESGTTTIQLKPRRCGTFSLDAAPSGAHYTLSSGGHEIASGAVPLADPVLVAEGTYALHVSAKYCADYSGSVSISSGSTARERVRLICQ